MALPPAELRVGPRLYTVHTDEETYRRVCDAHQQELEGNSNHPAETIMLRPGRAANWTADTYLHEVLHCILNLHGVSLKNVKDLDDLEEYLVTVMSPLLLMVLRDNPELVTFLQSPEVPWA